MLDVSDATTACPARDIDARDPTGEAGNGSVDESAEVSLETNRNDRIVPRDGTNDRLGNAGRREPPSAVQALDRLLRDLQVQVHP